MDFNAGVIWTVESTSKNTIFIIIFKIKTKNVIVLKVSIVFLKHIVMCYLQNE